MSIGAIHYEDNENFAVFLSVLPLKCFWKNVLFKITCLLLFDGTTSLLWMQSVCQTQRRWRCINNGKIIASSFGSFWIASREQERQRAHEWWNDDHTLHCYATTVRASSQTKWNINMISFYGEWNFFSLVLLSALPENDTKTCKCLEWKTFRIKPISFPFHFSSFQRQWNIFTTEKRIFFPFCFLFSFSECIFDALRIRSGTRENLFEMLGQKENIIRSTRVCSLSHRTHSNTINFQMLEWKRNEMNWMKKGKNHFHITFSHIL